LSYSTKCLRTLTFEKGHQGENPGGHNFVFLYFLIYRNKFEAEMTLVICVRVFTGNPLALIGHAQIS